MNSSSMSTRQHRRKGRVTFCGLKSYSFSRLPITFFDNHHQIRRPSDLEITMHVPGKDVEDRPGVTDEVGRRNAIPDNIGHQAAKVTGAGFCQGAFRMESVPYHGVDMQDQEARKIGLYTAIMEEIKFRIAAIEGLHRGNVNIHVALINEMSFLQLRMICELIALGCLVAHGDIEETTSLQKEWSADKIIDKLSLLHADFYPVPIESVIAAGTVFSGVAHGFLKKADLLALYGRCGGMLHRGSLKKILDPKYKEPATVIQQITAAMNQLYGLLSQHTMLLIDRNTLVICQMISSDDGSVKVFIAQGQPETQSTWPPEVA